MIFKGFVAAIVFSFAWIKSVTGGTSYSNAYMQRGPGLNFYGPAALKTAQLTPIAATPLMSSLLPPCVSPCVVPVEQVAALAPVATSSANFVSYKAPVSVPVVVAPANDDGTSYEYSYVVYDENTGDRKAQKETSDGSVVRGQYSLVQPNGYVREVQYTADDLKGFNAVVKNFLPEVQAKALLPCPEVKSEPLKMSNEKSEAAFDLSEPQPRRKANEKLKIQPKSYKKQESLKEPERLDEPKDDKAPKSLAENAKPESKKEQGKPKGQVVNAANAGPGSADEHIIEEQKNKQKKEGNKQEEPRASQDVTGGLPGDINALVSYNDIIKCIQSAIKRTNNSLQPLASPLTYIILNKPC